MFHVEHVSEKHKVDVDGPAEKINLEEGEKDYPTPDRNYQIPNSSPATWKTSLPLKKVGLPLLFYLTLPLSYPLILPSKYH